jgi:hypothetical protein
MCLLLTVIYNAWLGWGDDGNKKYCKVLRKLGDKEEK